MTNVKTLISFSSAPTRLIMAGLVTGLLLLSGCGGSSGSKVEPNTPPDNNGGNGTDPFVYEGEKPAATADINKFQKELWEKIARKDRCGGCHDVQAPNFAREDDINFAYETVIDNQLVNLDSPEESRLVTKVANGHNCWVADASACGEFITGWIQNWAGEAGTVENSIELTAPEIKDIANSKSFPADADLFAESDLYASLKEYCARCHSETSAIKQQPYFASDDPTIAYQAAKSKIRLDAPASSRFVVRLAAESHNCWSGNCATDAALLSEQIAAFVASLPAPEPLPESLPLSKAVGLADAFVLTSGGRVDSEIIVKYEFKTGRGSVAYDSTGSGIDLNIIGNVDWSSAWGVKIDSGGRLQATTANSRQIVNQIISTGEYSIETWVIPDNVDQGVNDSNPARIVTLSQSDEERNFALGQYDYNYSFLNRTDRSDINGLDEISTPDADQVLQASLQHVVATFDPINGRRIYVNGELIDIDDEGQGAVLRDWEKGFAFAVGNEVTGAANTQWKGSVRFLAMHKRALSADDIGKNYAQGVGARYLLLFSISELIDLPESYIVFEVQQMDDYGYLFSAPFFTNLNDLTPSSPITLRGIHIGVNGIEAPTGQVFANLNTAISADKIVDKRQPLSRLGTVVEVKTGPTDDVFFLSFDQIGDLTYDRGTPAMVEPSPLAITPEQPLLGLRDFAEINATLSYLTTIPTTAVSELYQKVEQQLPTLTNMDGFLSAHQMGITQLAVAYCSELVNDTGRRSTYFNHDSVSFNFAASPAAAFTTEGRDQIIEPILRKLLAGEVPNTEGAPSPLLNQADPDQLRTHLNDLIDSMAASCSANCTSAERTKTTVIAACAAGMSSAVMLLQ